MTSIVTKHGDGQLVAKVRVSVRVRPPLPREIGQDGKFCSCIGIGPNTDKGQTIFVNAGDKPVLLSDSISGGGKVSRYTFDRVFPFNASQEDVYTFSMQPLVAGVLQGYNATILAYGQTGSGKTHTILGENKENEGLTMRTIKAILSEEKILLHMSVLQIYQEGVYDLFAANPGESLSLRQSLDGVNVDGLLQKQVHSAEEGQHLLESAQKKRAVGGTLLNEVSSRSHMIIQLIVRSEDRIAKLNLVDLAGSERLRDSGAEGERLQETCGINSSLFALVAVVESLSSGKSFIPYRNSKLTWFLSDSLGGNSLTTILSTVSPSQKYAKETKSTLKFAHSCKKIEHLVVQNSLKPISNSKKLKPPETKMPWFEQEVELKTNMIETSLGRICCYYAGPEDGTPVVLLHGCPSNFSEFKHFLPGLSYMGYRVIGFDQPGYGSSPGVRATSRSDKAAEKGGPIDVLKEVLKHHKLEKPVLLGYDWGAGIALSFGVLFPARVGKVISFLPSFSETPDTQLHHMGLPTMVLWVKQDQNHSWRRFKALARKIPGGTIKFVNTPTSTREYSRNCYEKISDQILVPIIEFISGQKFGKAEQNVYKGKEIVTKSTVGENVVEVCNINFEDDLAPEELEQILSKPNPEANAVKLFENMGMKYGFEELYRAEENHTHKLHRAVSDVLRALPILSPYSIAKNPDLLPNLGIWRALPMGYEDMVASPRYFPGRQVLVKTRDLDDFDNESKSLEAGITKIGKISEVGNDVVTLAMDPFENYGKEVWLEVKKEDIVRLNSPHVFHREPNGKYSLEDGLHCDYKNKIVKAKLVEICLCLSPLVAKLDFLSPDCEEMQRDAIRIIRSRLNIVTFQGGVDRSRLARSDCAGRLAVNGQVMISQYLVDNYQRLPGSLPWG